MYLSTKRLRKKQRPRQVVLETLFFIKIVTIIVMKFIINTARFGAHNDRKLFLQAIIIFYTFSSLLRNIERENASFLEGCDSHYDSQAGNLFVAYTFAYG